MSGTIEPKNWKMLGYATEPICPIISAHTVKQANRYIECVRESCMWWNKCKPLETERPHGKWEWKSPTPETIMTPHCSNCGHMNDFIMETNFCPNCGAPMTEEAFRKYNGLKEGDNDED